MRRIAWIIGLLLTLLVMSTATAQETRTFVTEGGMSVTYPASLIASIGQGPQTLQLYRFSAEMMVNVRVVGDADALSDLGLATISSAETLLDGYRTQVAGLSEFDPAAVRDITLANGRALLQPFGGALGTGYFIGVEVTGGKFVFVEAIYSSLVTAPPDGSEQEWLDLAGSIRFDQPPTRVPDDIDRADLQTLDLPAGELLPSAMPAGFGVFSDDVVFPLPDGWVFSTDTTVSNTALLSLSNDLSGSMVITVQDTAPYATYADWRANNFVITGFTSADADGSPIEPVVLTRADGRSAERFVSAVGDSIQTTFIDLGGEQAATIMVSMLTDDADQMEASLAASDQIAVEIVRFNRNSPLETVTATCDTVITLEERQRFLYQCPAGCGDGSRVWGTDIYTGDSAVCAAAVHAGVIDAAAGGLVLATYAPGQDSYDSSTRNGITTNAYGPWSSSFTVAPPPTE